MVFKRHNSDSSWRDFSVYDTRRTGVGARVLFLFFFDEYSFNDIWKGQNKNILHLVANIVINSLNTNQIFKLISIHK